MTISAVTNFTTAPSTDAQTRVPKTPTPREQAADTVHLSKTANARLTGGDADGDGDGK